MITNVKTKTLTKERHTRIELTFQNGIVWGINVYNPKGACPKDLKRYMKEIEDSILECIKEEKEK